VKRHPALVPLSHDHHHALVHARRLRSAAAADADPAAAVAAFLEFFAAESVPHFREEEELLFPLVARSDEARPLVIQALLDHQALHALAQELRDAPDLRAAMQTAAERLDSHVRLEERTLFPLIERLAGSQLAGDPRAEAPSAGPVWGDPSEDLNATLLAWDPGGGPAEHVNAERDVLIAVVEGSATLSVGDEEHELRQGDAIIVPKGRRRRIVAGSRGVRYLSVHVRRPLLQITSPTAS
jgi:quercetin dioxygenase-like cupin family protein